MLKSLAGDLSAIFNLDGRHLDRFLTRRTAVVRSLCEQLLLHDQIIIPTQDYLTAAGLVRLIGEKNLITLLEADKLRFLRLRGFFGYARGTGVDGRLIAMQDPTGQRPYSAPIDQSIEASLNAIRGAYADHNKLKNALFAGSNELDYQQVVDATHRDAYADLSKTSLWKEEYQFPNPQLLALPGMKEMQVRVIGPNTDVAHNVVDCCLALGLMNIELWLMTQFDCTSCATGSPLGDCISLKIARLTANQVPRERLLSFLELTGVPDLAGPLLNDKNAFAHFIKLTSSRDAEAFRRWFHENSLSSEREIAKAYIALLQQLPLVQTATGKALRMAISLGLSAFGLGWVADAGASTIDNFVIDKFVRGRGAKFFVEKLKGFGGRIAGS